MDNRIACAALCGTLALACSSAPSSVGSSTSADRGSDVEGIWYGEPGTPFNELTLQNGRFEADFVKADTCEYCNIAYGKMIHISGSYDPSTLPKLKLTLDDPSVLSPDDSTEFLLQNLSAAITLPVAGDARPYRTLNIVEIFGDPFQPANRYDLYQFADGIFGRNGAFCVTNDQGAAGSCEAGQICDLAEQANPPPKSGIIWAVSECAVPKKLHESCENTSTVRQTCEAGLICDRVFDDFNICVPIPAPNSPPPSCANAKCQANQACIVGDYAAYCYSDPCDTLDCSGGGD